MNKSESGKLGQLVSAKTQKEKYEQRIKKYLENPNKCSNQSCNNILSYAKRTNDFCGHSCFAIINNRKRVRNVKVPRRINCMHCNNFLNKGANKFCSSNCDKEYKWKLRKDMIENGEVKNHTILKRYLVEKFGHQCSICGIKEWMNKFLVMILDHIDGNSENSNITNLRLLCSNCDSQSSTYKARNKGNGRHTRRQRYLENKSY